MALVDRSGPVRAFKVDDSKGKTLKGLVRDNVAIETHIMTDHFGSYGAAMKVIGNLERQECGRWLNNRAENSHQPFRVNAGAITHH